MKYLSLIISLSIVPYISAQLSRRCQRLDLSDNDNQDRDVCVNPFSAFLGCFSGKIESQIDELVQEGNAAAQTRAKQCFERHGCGAVSYDEDTALDTFLPCQYTDPRDRSRKCVWRNAADAIIDLLGDVPKPVSKCMITYFKGLGGRKIEKCTRDYPPTTGAIQPPFRMPPIPGYDDFDIPDMKRMLLYRLMTRHYLLKCASADCGTHKDQGPSLIGCLVQGQSSDSNDICRQRQNCERSSITGFCQDRYDSVHKSVCQCAKAELGQGLVAAFDRWDELKRGLIQGEFECRFEKCYLDNGLESQWGKRGDGGMYDKLRAVKSSVIKAVVKLTQGGGDLPPSLKHALVVVKSLIDEFSHRWAGTICSDCSNEKQSSRDLSRANYEHMVSQHDCDAVPENVAGLDELRSFQGGRTRAGSNGRHTQQLLKNFFQG